LNKLIEWLHCIERKITSIKLIFLYKIFEQRQLSTFATLSQRHISIVRMIVQMWIFICSTVPGLIATWSNLFKSLWWIVIHCLRLHTVSLILLTLRWTIKLPMVYLRQICACTPQLVVQFLTIIHYWKSLRLNIHTFKNIFLIILTWIRSRWNIFYLFVFRFIGCIDELIHLISFLYEFHHRFIRCYIMQNFIITFLTFHH
jgi:hypothetical protein